MDGILKDSTIPGQSEPGSNSNEGEHHIAKIYKIWPLPSM